MGGQEDAKNCPLGFVMIGHTENLYEHMFDCESTEAIARRSRQAESRRPHHRCAGRLPRWCDV
jgi:hypothetical protein